MPQLPRQLRFLHFFNSLLCLQSFGSNDRNGMSVFQLHFSMLHMSWVNNYLHFLHFPKIIIPIAMLRFLPSWDLSHQRILRSLQRIKHLHSRYNHRNHPHNYNHHPAGLLQQEDRQLIAKEAVIHPRGRRQLQDQYTKGGFCDIRLSGNRSCHCLGV